MDIFPKSLVPSINMVKGNIFPKSMVPSINMVEGNGWTYFQNLWFLLSIWWRGMSGHLSEIFGSFCQYGDGEWVDIFPKSLVPSVNMVEGK